MSMLGNPKLTGPILLSILLYPQHLQSIIPANLPWLRTALVRTLGFFFSISIVKLTSAKLSQWGLNNYRPDAKFVKSQELVLITGGTSGIGELTAREFAKQGVKVVVIDIHPPKDPLRKICPIEYCIERMLTIQASGITFYECDVTSTSQVAAVGEKIRKAHGDPTVLVSCQLFLYVAVPHVNLEIRSTTPALPFVETSLTNLK